MNARDLLAELREVVAKLQAETGTPGVAFGLVADGTPASDALGTTSVTDPRDVTTGTLFRLCSVTKPMTSTVAMSLVEEGALDLDRPVVEQLPDLALADADTRAGLTLRHLLTHTSGLEGEWRGDLERYGRNDDALARLVADYPRLAQYAPLGRYWGYCNTGYWLAGHLVATVSGRSYEDVLRERVFAPLGMSTAALAAEEVVLQRVALPHRPSGVDQVPIPSFAFPRARVSSGGVVASIDDLLRFAASSLGHGPQVVGAASLAQLREPAVASDGPDAYQSLGWQVDGDVVSHSGSYKGYASLLLLIPSADLAVAVLTNSDSGGRLGRGVRSWAAERVLGRSAHEPEPVTVPVAVLRRYAGRYAHPSVVSSRFFVGDDGGLRVEVTKAPGQVVESGCVAYSDTDFEISGGPLAGTAFTFLPDDAGDPAFLRIGLRLGARIA